MKHFTKDEFEQLTYVKSGTFGSVFHDGKIAFKKYHHEIKAIGYVLIKNPCLKQKRHKFKRMWKRQSKIEYTDLICDTFSIDNDYSGVCYPYYQGQLLEEIRKEDNSYLKILRILEALNATEAINKVKKTSDKIKFCLEFQYLAANGYNESISTQFKVIALLDRV